MTHSFSAGFALLPETVRIYDFFNLKRVDSDTLGAVRYKQKQVISLLHAFFAGRFSVFNIAHPEHNRFEFTIDPRIVEVEFNGIVLHYQDGRGTGRPASAARPHERVPVCEK